MSGVTTSTLGARPEQLKWALLHYCQCYGHVLDRAQLSDAVRGLGGDCDTWSDIGRVLHQLHLPAPTLTELPDIALLPMLADVPTIGWSLVVQSVGEGRWKISHPGGSEVVSIDALRGNVGLIRVAKLHPSDAAEDEENQPGRAPSFHAAFASSRYSHRGALKEVALGSLIISMIGMAISFYSMQVYDRVIPTQGLSTLVVLAIGALLAVSLELALKFARARVLDDVVVQIDSTLSRFIFQRLLSIRVDQLPVSVGSLASQLRGYEQLRSFYTSSTIFALVDMPLAVIFLVCIAAIGGLSLAVVPLSMLLLLLGVGAYYRFRFQTLSREGLAMTNMKTGLLVETVEGAETIKASGGGWKFLQRWVQISAGSIRVDLETRSNSDGLVYAATLISHVSYIGIVSVGAWLAIQGHITVGGLIACSILIGRVMAPFTALPSLLVQHAQARAASESIDRLCRLDTDHSNVHRPLAPEQISGDFRLSDVRFSYLGSRDAPLSLAVQELRIHAGERVGIIGPVGSGKSTLLRLLSGLYRPQSGRVLLDGLDISHIDRGVISQNIGYIQQDIRLFQGTLRDNLLVGIPELGDQVIHAAMRRSRLLQLVADHPRGIDLPIFEGGRGLSGGQRQLVAFTRLLITKPGVWLLDEPTCSMDEELERNAIAILAEEMRSPGRTLVVVTHKNAMLQLVNRLIVIVGNRIVLDGPRDEVLARLNAQRSSTTAPSVRARADQLKAEPA